MRRNAVLVLFSLITVLQIAMVAQPSKNSHAADVIRKFEQGLNHRSLAEIESVVASDVVVLENGRRNKGWVDFRDNHLVPELKEPASPIRSELIKIMPSDVLTWAYTKSELKLADRTGKPVDALLWTVYVLEKRNGDWKIVLLDWSMRISKPSPK